MNNLITRDFLIQYEDMSRCNMYSSYLSGFNFDESKVSKIIVDR